MIEDFAYHDRLGEIAAEDVRYLKVKDRSYGGSWKAAGGRSAYFMLRRKMDRMIAMLSRPAVPAGFSLENIAGNLPNDCRLPGDLVQHLRDSYTAEDIFAKIEEGPGGEDGTVLAEVRDLRRYLLLVEAYMMQQDIVARPERLRATNGQDNPRGFDPAQDLRPE
jgi:hypothetical protein